jgi:hypothetical protein
VFQANGLALGVFADDDEVDAGPLRLETRKIADGPEVGEQVELLAEGDIDAFEAAADGGGNGALESYLVTGDGVAEIGGDEFAENFEGLGSSGEAFPLPLDAGSFEDAEDGLRNFRADAVAGDEGDFVRSVFRHN